MMKARSRLRHALVCVLAAAALAGPAGAHVTKPEAKHGGYVIEAKEIFFELVWRPDRLIIHIEDDGTPVPTRGMTGSVRFASRGTNTAQDLGPGEANVLFSEIQKPPRGTPVTISIALDKAHTVRLVFVVR